MATRSYTIPDLDDDNESESLNLFSKRIKTDNSSTTNKNISSSSTATNESIPSSSTITNENLPSSSIPLNIVNETETESPSSRPPPPPSSSSLLVHSRQRGNPLLKHFRQIKWEYSDTILGGADYSMSRSSCALFLSLRYHTLNTNYIYDRLKSTKLPYQLKILLIQCDVGEPSQSLKELARLCILYDLTLLVSWTDEESARYLETYKIMEGKSAENLMDTQQHQSTDYLTKLTDTLTQVKSVNKTDAQTLLHAFGSLKSIFNASNEQLCVCPGLGTLKAQRLYQSFTQPFKRQKVKTKINKKEKIVEEKNFDEEQHLDLSVIDEDF